ncbi:MAG: NADH-quinone oxidoreductase subunit L [Methanomicrobiales archaeon]|nr:NADH-quinone oxidoreductase subunit L [Methanomicrobiales archaeon]
MEFITFVILFPLLLALLLYTIRKDRTRSIVVYAGAAILSIASLLLLYLTYGQEATYFQIQTETFSYLLFIVEVLIGAYLLWLAYTHKRWLVSVLVLAQLALITVAEFGAGHHTEPYLFIDEFSAIMAVIIGVVGSLICVYAVGYMRDWHAHHKGEPDQRRFFFAVMFLFLSAMFGIVFSDNLSWIYAFWEVTTLCSFLLIGYSKSEEATNNAFWALTLNLIGGLAFAGAIVYIKFFSGAPEMMSLKELTLLGPVVALIPVALISFAGLTKSAQMPFSTWLVGAMVAPTPVSALLHSATMVKAGVYIIVRFAPVLQGTALGLLFALIGGVTFFAASCIAASQSNAKKVLAYSTIANLGLIVACAGIGTGSAIWAAIFLILFHAVAKSLLFMSVGTVEHRIGSRDIDSMVGLIHRLPIITTMMLVGIGGMFLPPFGMLIAKWATIQAFLLSFTPVGVVLIGLLAYGSAVTVFFWAKWMGSLIRYDPDQENEEGKVSFSELIPIQIIGFCTIAVCILFPLISAAFLIPFLNRIFGEASSIIGTENTIIVLLMVLLIVALPFSILYYNRKGTPTSQYIAGRTGTAHTFSGSLGMTRTITLDNYYLGSWFAEKNVLPIGTIICIALLIFIGTIAGVSFLTGTSDIVTLSLEGAL